MNVQNTGDGEHNNLLHYSTEGIGTQRTVSILTYVTFACKDSKYRRFQKHWRNIVVLTILAIRGMKMLAVTKAPI
jgi:hypothetical protein